MKNICPWIETSCWPLEAARGTAQKHASLCAKTKILNLLSLHRLLQSNVHYIVLQCAFYLSFLIFQRAIACVMKVTCWMAASMPQRWWCKASVSGQRKKKCLDQLHNLEHVIIWWVADEQNQSPEVHIILLHTCFINDLYIIPLKFRGVQDP